MPKAVDRQQINEGIEKVLWIAALKPANCGIPDFRDAQRDYIEVAVLRLILRPDAPADRLVELLLHGVRHPEMLLISQQGSMQLSLSHKRWAQNEVGKIVLDSEPVSVDVCLSDRELSEFLAVIPIPQQSIRALSRLD